MAKDYSKHQQKIIDNYYQNLDAIALQKLQEIVTEIYLCESPKKTEQLWQRVSKAMINLKIHPQIMEHIMNRRDVKVLANNVEMWQKKK